MTIQAINRSPNVQYPLLSAGSGKNSSGLGLVDPDQSVTGGTNLGQTQRTILSEKYSVGSLVVKYSSGDGDSVTLSASSVDYQKAVLAANDDNSPESWQKIIDAVKDEYVKMKGAIVSAVFGDEESRTTAVSDPRAFDESKEIPGLPEYWNAENTSQRIVDFATSFIGMFKGSDEEFISMIKGAIEDGFSQAKDILGNLPDPVAKLAAKTHALVMDKIDTWASERSTAAQSADTQSAAAGV